MRKIVGFFTIMTILICATSAVMAGSVEFRTVEVRNDKSTGGEFHLDLEIRITSGTSPRTLNSLTADIYYGDELNTWSSNPATGWAFGSANGYTRSANKNSDYYRVLVTGGGVNENAAEPPDEGDPPGWDVTNSWEKIVTLRWTIAQATSVNISISDDTDDAAYFNNYQNVSQGDATDWTVSNQDPGDVSLPVSLVAFTATNIANGVTIKWRTATEVGNVGFSIYRSEKRDGAYKEIAFICGAGNSAMPIDYQFTDKKVEAGKNYFYYLEDIDLEGEKDKSDIIEVVVPPARPVPKEFQLLQNYPNPFNPETWLPYQLSQDVPVTINIYNVKGQLVRSLHLGNKKAGIYVTKSKAAYWDGKNETGQAVSSGIFFYHLTAGSFSATRRMLILK